MSVYFRMKVLVVDDEKPVRMVVSKLCQKIGFGDVYSAANGNEALQVLDKEDIDLVICDIEMSPMNGIDLLHMLRGGRDKTLKNIPFIFLTSHSESDIVLAAKSLNVEGYVVKPVDVVSLKKRVDLIFGM